MLAADFISTWRSVDLTERAAAQSHFCELCTLLGEKTPIEADRTGEWNAASQFCSLSEQYTRPKQVLVGAAPSTSSNAQKIQLFDRYIVTPETAQYRLFCWLSYLILPDKNLIVIARSDDTTFGVLHSCFHEQWALRLGTSLEDGRRYTSTSTFASFPFPEELTPNRPAAEYADDPHAIVIAEVARRLNELREAWLNPSDLVERVAEVVPGFSRPHCPGQPEGSSDPEEAHLDQSL